MKTPNRKILTVFFTRDVNGVPVDNKRTVLHGDTDRACVEAIKRGETITHIELHTVDPIYI